MVLKFCFFFYNYNFPVHVFWIYYFNFSGLTSSNYTELSQLYDKYRNQGIFCYIHQTEYVTYCVTFLSFVVIPLVFLGFEILAFPCNQFGGQEPESNPDIKRFVCTRFKAEFPIFDKVWRTYTQKQKNLSFSYLCYWLYILKTCTSWRVVCLQVDVNGPSTAPIYQFLKSKSGGFLGDLIKWNFEKFLVDKKGNVVQRYPPTTSPLQIEVLIFDLLYHFTSSKEL